MIFQSTGPLRDPTVTDGNIYTVSFISIHRSLAGPDNRNVTLPPVRYISIHRSLAGPDALRQSGNRQEEISIHRSLAGPDDLISQQQDILARFQSTGPLRDPTAILHIIDILIIDFIVHYCLYYYSMIPYLPKSSKNNVLF